MSRLEVLNNVDHHDCKIRLGHGREWGDAVNLVLVFPTEFEELQREYPILIRREPGGGWHAAAVLGLDRDENLFLHGDEWRARYVPAARRMAPFRLAYLDAPPGEAAPDPVVQIDLDHPRVTRGDGAPLFREHGGHGPYLQAALRMLQQVQLGLELAGPMFAAFERHGLIEPARLEISLDADTRYDIPDVFTINAARLAALPGPALEELSRAGFLRLATMLSASLGNVAHLIERKNQARRSPAGLARAVERA